MLPAPCVLLARQRQVTLQMLLLPEYSRDKRGYNVAILMLQLLHFLRERNLEPVLLRLERLRKYQQRYLTEASTLHSRLFLRLLQVIVEKNFDPKKAAEWSQNLLQKLRDAPPPRRSLRRGQNHSSREPVGYCAGTAARRPAGGGGIAVSVEQKGGTSC